MELTAVLYLTNRCNLFCDHCDQSSGNARENELTTSEILQGVEKLLKGEPFEHLQFEISESRVPHNSTPVAGQEIRHVCLSGGEPVLHKDFFYIARTLMDWGLEVSFITNATFSPVYYSRILELDFNAIYVSLDGLENTHNLLRRSGLSFKRVIQFLEFVNDCLAKPVAEIGLNATVAEPLNSIQKVFSGDLYVVTCVTSKSVNDLEALSELLSKYKITKWFLKPLEMKGRALEHPELWVDASTEEQFLRYSKR
ncbi:MAG: radical SAM protein [bacterium]